MRRSTFLRLGALVGTIVVAGCGRDTSSAPAAGTNSPAAGDENAAGADRDWTAALARGEAAAATGVMDAEFEWTDTAGRTRSRAESIEAITALATDLRGESDVRSYGYGHVTAITSARPDARTMRVWVRRAEGWRVFAVIGTALVTGTTPFAASGGGAGADCDNPCRTMPFTPTTENEKTIAGIFQQLKVDEWHPNPERWAPYVLDDVYYVTATAQLSKADRVARLTKLKETGAPSVPGDPVVSMRIVDLDDSAVMTARHNPYHGGKPYYSVRVWALREGRWQLANTQQTVVAAAPEAAATR
jgi:hypothetical protein